MSRRPTPGPRRRPRPTGHGRRDPADLVALTGAVLSAIRDHFGRVPTGQAEMSETTSALIAALGAHLGAALADNDDDDGLHAACERLGRRVEDAALVSASMIRMARGAVNGGHK